jgi:hypothetical protein
VGVSEPKQQKLSSSLSRLYRYFKKKGHGLQPAVLLQQIDRETQQADA